MRSFIAALVFCLLATTARAEGCIPSVSAIGDSSQLGTKTAGGIPLDDNALTAGPKSPSGSKVKVINKQNGPCVSITLTDRGPYLKGHYDDLTKPVRADLPPE
jgi:hypothetical protein